MKEQIKTFRGENLKSLEEEANKWLRESEKELVSTSIATDFEVVFKSLGDGGAVKGVRNVVKGYTVIYIILITYK